MVQVYYSPAYTSTGYSFDTTRKARWVAESLSESPMPGIELVAPASLTHEQVAAAHDPSYVNAVRNGQPRGLAESQGFDWDEQLWPTVLVQFDPGPALDSLLTQWATLVKEIRGVP